MEITNNKRGYRFEILTESNDTAYLEYRWQKGNMLIMRTFVPASARLTGLGSKLVQHALTYAAQHGIQLKAYCPFAAKYLAGHPEYQHLVAE
jgi:hypothetical protein